jgi:hypothetical protein
MSTTSIDRIAGLSSSVAIKAPCNYTTTANITLSGLAVQAGGTWGSTLTQDDNSPTRILVKNQTNAIDNGIWHPGAGTWTRARDFDGARDVVSGTLAHVFQDGVSVFHEVATANPIVIGTTALTIAGVQSSAIADIRASLADTSSASNGFHLVSYTKTAAESTAGVTLVEPEYPPGDIRRYGCVCDATTSSDGTDDTLAWVNAVAVANAGQPIFVPAGLMSTFRGNVGAGVYSLALGSGARVYGPGAINYNPITTGYLGVLHTGGIFSEANTDKSNIVIDGVRFFSRTDQEYLHFIGIRNRGGDLTDITVQNCEFRYEASTHTGSDRWAISLGGAVGDVRTRINILNNRQYGRMQLTAGGQGADWIDVCIKGNISIGGYVAAIAITRLESGAGNDYQNIDITDNFILMSLGAIGIYLGADSDTLSPEEENWQNIVVARNTIIHKDAGTKHGVLFRLPVTGTVDNISITHNNIHSVSSGVNLTIHDSSTCVPTDVMVANNVITGGDITSSWKGTTIKGNTATEDITLLVGSITEVCGNKVRGLRAEATCTVFSNRNTYRIAAANGRGINVNAPAANTIVLTSVDDTFTYVSTITPQAGIRLSGAGTVTATVIKPHDAVRSAWGDNLLRFEDSKTLTFYEPDSSGLQNTFTAAQIAAIGNVVNTSGQYKFAGSVVWDTTNTRAMRAAGSATNSPWVVVDGSASVTPA